MSQFKKFLLSRVRPEKLKSFGLRLLIAGLVADIIVLIVVPAGLCERLLSAVCTAAIVIGIWIEEVGDHGISLVAKMPRWELLEEKTLVERLKQFAGTTFDIGFSGR